MVDDNMYDFMTDKDLLKKAVKIWGEDAQLFIAAEELAELIQAISKWKRYHGEEQKQWVIEEMADVLLMIMQLIYIVDIDFTKVREHIHKKQDIIRERLAKYD